MAEKAPNVHKQASSLFDRVWLTDKESYEVLSSDLSDNWLVPL